MLNVLFSRRAQFGREEDDEARQAVGIEGQGSGAAHRRGLQQCWIVFFWQRGTMMLWFGICLCGNTIFTLFLKKKFLERVAVPI